ncbi:hypothetical protein [Microbacterium sp. APC 3901]|uniref:hypothetical protein n=1 Tax=Microbacterium sp. APC 3901 TaxID=3035192 RepID=UPI0025B5AA5C|nr:hypothetical protein [Microbacterium sp. APC 3901]MDN3443761.1 hypothetical protein [Microbacterium sp. APC 3901]
MNISRLGRTRFADSRPQALLQDLIDDETGDVPGWVLVTLMTAGLVVLIWAVAGPALSALFEQAIQRVSGL